MMENKNNRQRANNLYDDGNIPKVDLPKNKEQQRYQNKVNEIKLPGRMRATDIIPDEVPGRSGPGGE